jgi:hypothetical protein
LHEGDPSFCRMTKSGSATCTKCTTPSRGSRPLSPKTYRSMSI